MQQSLHLFLLTCLLIFVQNVGMQRISTLIQKLSELAEQEKKLGLIDIDLMLDYTRVMYADLLEVRKNYVLNDIVSAEPREKPDAVIKEHTSTMPSNSASSMQAPEPVIKEEPSKPEVEIIINEEPSEIEPLGQQAVSKQDDEPAPEPIITRVPQINYAAVPNIDIRTRIGINDKYLFISELFGNDKTAYDDAVKHLNGFNTIVEAESWVNTELVPKYGWDREQETVQSFYDLLSQSFPAT